MRDEAFRDEHLEYLQPQPTCRLGAAGGRGGDASGRRRAGPDVVGVVLALHRHVGAAIRYAPGATYVGVDVDEVLAQARGVCQDYAHLAVAMCRSIGIPARYVSGYLFATNDATGADVDGDVVRVQTHAWFEAAVPGVGWLALDPTNAPEVGLRHVTIGHGRDYDDVPPLRGVFAGGGHADARRQRRDPPPGARERRGRCGRCASRATAAAQQRLDEARARRARLAQQAQQAQQ